MIGNIIASAVAGSCVLTTTWLMALITGNERLADRLRRLASLLMLVLVISVWLNRVAGNEPAADLVLIGGLLTVSLGLGVVVTPALPRNWHKFILSLVEDEPVERPARGDHPEYERRQAAWQDGGGLEKAKVAREVAIVADEEQHDREASVGSGIPAEPGFGEQLSDVLMNGCGSGLAGFALSYLWSLQVGLRGSVEGGNVVFAVGIVLVLVVLALTDCRTWRGPTWLAVAVGLVIGFFGEQQDWVNLTGK